MKKLNIKYFTVILIFLFVGCEAPTVGYNTYEWGKDYKFSLGSEESVEIAVTMSEALDKRDFETVEMYSTDSVSFYGGDGIKRDLSWLKETIAVRDSVRAANKATVEVELKHAYSIVLNPNNGREVVKTHFIYTYKDSLDNVDRWRQYETYVVKDGKVDRWSGAWQDIPEETE